MWSGIVSEEPTSVARRNSCRFCNVNLPDNIPSEPRTQRSGVSRETLNRLLRRARLCIDSRIFVGRVNVDVPDNIPSEPRTQRSGVSRETLNRLLRCAPCAALYRFSENSGREDPAFPRSGERGYFFLALFGKLHLRLQSTRMRLLEKYESLGILGRGSMGQVHAARPIDDPVTTVVVKVMRKELVDSPRARELFEREIRYTARLDHPYIVRVLNAGVDEAAGPCIVMEFVPGITLESLLQKEKRLSVDRAGWLVACLCHALEVAHTSGIIHRDLKPANLMIVNAGTPQEHLKVMDFGLAQLASKPYLSKERLSGSSLVIAQGTPAYISPEQLRGDDVDGRADLYSSGVIFFEALTGRLPFPETEIDRVIEAHLKRTPPQFAELNIRGVPAAFEAVIQRCLAKFPSERPASARVLGGELGKAFGKDLWSETTSFAEVRADENIPIAEDVPPEQDAGPNTLVRKTEAWMPDRIAVIKLGGFLQDAGGEILSSHPGLLRARFASTPKPASFLDRLFGKSAGDGIDLDLSLNKPNPSESRLIVTAIFRVTRGGPPKDPAAWQARALKIFEEMKSYVMAQR